MPAEVLPKIEQLARLLQQGSNDGTLSEGAESGELLGNYSRLKARLKVLSFVQFGEPAGTRTQDPRLKRAISGDRDRVRWSETMNNIRVETMSNSP